MVCVCVCVCAKMAESRDCQRNLLEDDVTECSYTTLEQTMREHCLSHALLNAHKTLFPVDRSSADTLAPKSGEARISL